MTQPMRTSYHHDIKILMKSSIIILAICFVCICCQKENPCYKKNGMVRISNSAIADTVLQNENSPISIVAFAENGCWSNLFVDLKEETSFEYSIKAYGTFTCCEGGCACPDVLVSRDTIINFQPTQKGNYIFNIYTSQSSITIDTMIAN
jgi:hypothetical protein